MARNAEKKRAKELGEELPSYYRFHSDEDVELPETEDPRAVERRKAGLRATGLDAGPGSTGKPGGSNEQEDDPSG